MRVTSNGRVGRSKAEWQALCEQFAQSGIGQQEFCQREAIPVGSFKKWYQRCTVRPSQSEALVELVSPAVRSIVTDRRSTLAMVLATGNVRGVIVRVRLL